MNPKKVNINIDLKDATDFKCPKCDGNLFDVVYSIFKISKMLPSNPTGKDIIKQVPHFKCVNKKCGHILKDIRPR